MRFRELGYFDTVPDSDSIGHTGASRLGTSGRTGAVTVSDTESGLFVLRPVVDRCISPFLCGADPAKASTSYFINFSAWFPTKLC